MAVNRKRTKRLGEGHIKPWVKRYMKDGTIPKEGTADYDEYCSWWLLKMNVPGMPEYEHSKLCSDYFK